MIGAETKTEPGIIFLFSEWDVRGHDDQVSQEPKRRGNHVSVSFALVIE